METLRINGVTYEITRSITAENATVEQRKLMRRLRQSRLLFMRRPRGRGVTYHAVEYRNKAYSEVVSLGVW